MSDIEKIIVKLFGAAVGALSAHYLVEHTDKPLDVALKGLGLALGCLRLFKHDEPLQVE